MKYTLFLGDMICADLFFCNAWAAAGKKNLGEVKLIVGTVKAEVKIMDENGNHYTVLRKQTGEGLLKNRGQKVIVTGKVEEERGVKSIRIRSYQLWRLPGRFEKQNETD